MLADGDGSLDPADSPSLVNALITEKADMAVGTRFETVPGLGLLDWLYRRSLGASFADPFSGYRAFTRRFVKSFPPVATGFDIETELSVHAGQMMVPVAEIELAYAPGADADSRGAAKNWLRVVKAVAMLTKETRPFAFYSAIAMVFWIAGLISAMPIGQGSSALVATALFLIGFLSAACGLVLDGLGRARVEQKRILFLTVPALGTQ